MSLTRDGVWKAGVWATTVWASGVWAEGVTPPVAVPVVSGGGGILHVGRHRTKDEIQAERERLGILPKPELVRQALAKPDPVEALEDGLELEAVAYKAAYREALLYELRLRQQREDEAIALVLLLH